MIKCFPFLLMFFFPFALLSQGTDCATATEITAAGDYNGSVAFGAGGQDFWYINPAVTQDYELTISSNSDCGVVVDGIQATALQTGDCVPPGPGDFLRIVSNATAACPGNVSTTTVTLVAGNFYYFQVASFSVEEDYTFTIGTPAIPLPVELTSFDAKYNKDLNSVELNWATSSESNSSHFIVERSDNGSSFEKIGAVDASGFSETEKEYSFQDVLPNQSKLFYRLRLIDLNQSFTFSNIRSIDKKGNELSVIRSGKILTITQPDIDDIYIYDVSGRLVKTVNSSNQVDLTTHSNGVYFVVTRSKNAIQSEKIVLN